jgi:hypothetical protein
MEASQSSSDRHTDLLPEDRAGTPPPPYQFEDYSGHTFHTSHDPESAALEPEIPYAFRGWRSCATIYL